MNASVRFRTDPPGVVEVPARDHPVVVIHVGPSVYIHCRRGSWSHSGLAVHGDIDIVPAGVPGRWEMKERDNVVLVDVENPGVEILNRFQIRDRKLELLGRTMWKETLAGNPNGRVYLDSLGESVAEHLLESHSSASPPRPAKGGLPKLKRVLAYIEDNLSYDLSLKQIAGIAGLSVSHLKTTFRQSVGLPVHQYIIERRVDRAQVLLREGKLPVARIAAETGFAHQSHLAHHLRRAFPSESARLIHGDSRTIADDDRSSSRS
jgi:AraC family transcriptional regulator